MYRWRKHAFAAISPDKISSLERLRDFFAIYLLDQFGKHMIIGLFKRFELGIELDGASTLFKVTAQDTLECWLTENFWIGLSRETSHHLPVLGPKMEAAHIRNRWRWINGFEHEKLLDDLKCSWLVLPATDDRSTPLIDFGDI